MIFDRKSGVYIARRVAFCSLINGSWMTLAELELLDARLQLLDV